MITQTQPIRWPFIFLLALTLSILGASAIFGPPAFKAFRAAERTAKDQRPTLQTFVEGGDFSYSDDKAKNVLPLLPYDSISLERSGCFGDCPAYIVTFYKDGHATLVTDNWRDHGKKYYKGKIWLGEFVRLTQMVDLARHAAHQVDYAGQWTDDYTATIRASSNGSSWVVSDYGRVAPVEVWALETLLHTFQEKSEWAPVAGP